MGCASSKDVAVVADVAYRPPAASVSLFDVSAVEEPWLIAKKNAAANRDLVEADHSEEDESESEDEEEESSEDEQKEDAKKPTTGVALPILDKLDGYELAPASWSEVSKALEDIKPTLDSKQTTDPKPPPPKKKKKKKKAKKQPAAQAEPQPPPPPPQKEQLSSQTQTPSVVGTAVADKKAPPAATPYVHGSDTKKPPPELTGRRVVKENPFLLRDRETKNADGTTAPPKWRRRDPFEGYPERRPPGASGGGVVLYTTTLRGVRRTFDDCERARAAVETCAEAAGLPVYERDVALHGEYLRELRELLQAADGEEQGAGVSPPPRLFVMGRYLGGAEACTELVENGKLAEMLRWARARGEACAAKDGRGCEGCGGARFVPCLECGGSCKVVVGGDGSVTSGVVERCGKCNENGLMMCPICH